MKRGVFITIDVECGMGGAWGDPSLRPVPPSLAVMGEYNGHQYGLPLLVDILSGHGLAATFFVEPFAAEQGHPGHMEPISHFLLDRGQDVQLHIHPGNQQYGLHRAGMPHPRTDQIAALAADAQRALLAEGCERIARWTGRRPVAFRAGNMAASEGTLLELPAVGITIDSSYTFPYAGGQCRFRPTDPYNGSKWYGNVLELALSGFRQRRLPGLAPAKPLDIMGISFEECRDAINSICDAGGDAVVILHSFSLFKIRNKQYHGGRLNRIVSRRFRRLCGWLAEQGAGRPAYTFSQLAKAIESREYSAAAVPPCMLPAGRSLVRKIVQAYNSLYWT